MGDDVNQVPGMKQAPGKHVQTVVQEMHVKGLVCARQYSRFWGLNSEKTLAIVFQCTRPETPNCKRFL